MAFSNSLVKGTVFGDVRVQIYSMVADAATGTIDTGLGAIYSIHATAQSAASSSHHFQASGSSVVATGVASGDVFYVTVYGR